MIQRLDKNGQSSRPKFETRHKQARCPRMKISTVARKKLGVYNKNIICSYRCSIVSEWVRAMHEGLIGDGVQDFLLTGHQRVQSEYFWQTCCCFGALGREQVLSLCWGQLERLSSCFLGLGYWGSICRALKEWCLKTYARGSPAHALLIHSRGLGSVEHAHQTTPR